MVPKEVQKESKTLPKEVQKVYKRGSKEVKLCGFELS